MGNKEKQINTIARTLETGETFYTNYPLDGASLGERGFVSLKQYLTELKDKFPSVKTSEIALDSSGTQIDGTVAVFVSRD